MAKGLYRSRLGRAFDPKSRRLISSLNVDASLLEYEVDSSEAHLLMLTRAGLVRKEEAVQIVRALESLRGKKLPADGYEDIHEYVEACVTELTSGEVGGRLHTARSRNDQVATITRMKSREELLELASRVLELVETLIILAEKEATTPLLSYTHLRQAQVQTLGHHLMSYAWPMLRNAERLIQCYDRTNRSPLGAAVGAGSTIEVDREMTARLLGFDSLMTNCQDAVQSRDFALEASFLQCNIMIDLSRLAEDLILWSSSEFHYFELPDIMASPSSAMPHKKNPDVLEMIRANTSSLIGNLVEMLSTMKALPSGYNRDLQNVKAALLASFPVTRDAISSMKECLERGHFFRKEMKLRVEKSDVFALPLAEWLVINKAVPFRTAHRIAGKVSSFSPLQLTSLTEMAPSELSKAIVSAKGPHLTPIEASILKQFLSTSLVLKSTKTRGGPSRRAVLEDCVRARRRLGVLRLGVVRRSQKLQKSKRFLTRSLHELFENSTNEASSVM
jgi:argininosuccinate lyase